MRKLTYIVAFVLFMTVPLVAQISDDATVQVEVYVVRALEVIGQAPLQFGFVVDGNEAIVASNDFDNAAQFEIRASEDFTIDISITPPQELTGPGDDIPFTALDPYRSDDSEGNNSEVLDNWVSNGGGELQTNDNTVFLWFGGSIVVDVGQAEGVYSGTYMVSADYTNDF